MDLCRAQFPDINAVAERVGLGTPEYIENEAPAIRQEHGKAMALAAALADGRKGRRRRSPNSIDNSGPPIDGA